MSVEQPTNLQAQSPLCQLPAEVKHLIFSECWPHDTTFTDPVLEPSEAPSYSHGGVALLQTCRRLYHDLDRRPLFAQNSFRFTSADALRTFLRALDPSPRAAITDIAIDVRNVCIQHPERALDWLHYLAWGKGEWAGSIGSLCIDAPGLAVLRFHFDTWPAIPLPRLELWNLLRGLLGCVEGLQRVVVTGASKGAGMAMRAPFSPVHFVGGDDVGFDDLVPRMWAAVSSPDHGKIVRWTRAEGKLQLEVVALPHLLTHVEPAWAGPSVRKSHTDPWPTCGSCTWFGYENRDSDVTNPTTKGPDPSTAE